MSEAIQDVSSAVPETTVIENVGGPKIPGPQGGVKAPNMQGVAQPQEQEVPAALDIQALAQSLNKSETVTTEEKELAETGNPAIDAGIAMLKQVAKLNDADMVRAIGKAVERGDATLIDTAFIKERFGEHAAYAELLAKAYLDDQVGQAQKAVNSAYEAAGGKEKWEAAAQVFNAKAPQHLRNAARALADSGDIQGASKLVLETCQSMGMIAQVNPMLKGGAGTAGALTAQAFSEEYAKLRKEVGNRSLESSAFNGRYQELLARRAAGKRAGI
ncbi:capsid assembly scaffolding protein [Escherichia phage vB_EcoP_PAS7]|uniref:Capsid assembly scaffolding protein n=1 Tax=Escherichia phage vB_EcoP_PAS7 TaxID=3053875 RepID=A0AA51VHH3_9CAUD|nr:capsid assembly scaffolding protein [Escherichia phage vB_EcoP_PAS7]